MRNLLLVCLAICIAGCSSKPTTVAVAPTSVPIALAPTPVSVATLAPVVIQSNEAPPPALPQPSDSPALRPQVLIPVAPQNRTQPRRRARSQSTSQSQGVSPQSRQVVPNQAAPAQQGAQAQPEITFPSFPALDALSKKPAQNLPQAQQTDNRTPEQILASLTPSTIATVTGREIRNASTPFEALSIRSDLSAMADFYSQQMLHPTLMKSRSASRNAWAVANLKSAVDLKYNLLDGRVHPSIAGRYPQMIDDLIRRAQNYPTRNSFR